MFDTFEMEDQLLSSLKRHHSNFIKQSPIGLSQAQNTLDEGKPVGLGRMRIGSLLQEIMDRHGVAPKTDYPKIVMFALVSPESHYVKNKKVGAFFSQGPKSGMLYIVKVTPDVKDLQYDDESLKSTLHHELQHLIKNMYDNRVLPSVEEQKMEGGARSPSYYSKSAEIQAYCAGIARDSMQSWMELTQFAIRNWPPEKTLEKIQEWRSEETVKNIFSSFTLSIIRDFDETKNHILSENPELKQKYLYYSFRNINTLLSRHLEKLEAETMGELSKSE